MQTVAQNFLSFAVKRMELTEKEIHRCTALLTHEQMWHRGGPHENSVANLLLHLAGNIRQWILHGIGGAPDVRTRDSEFALEPVVSAAEAQAQFQQTLAEARAVIAAIPEDRLLTTIDPQPNGPWRHLTHVEAVFQVVGHLQLHAGQIILLTKQMTGRDLDLSIPRKR